MGRRRSILQHNMRVDEKILDAMKIPLKKTLRTLNSASEAATLIKNKNPNAPYVSFFKKNEVGEHVEYWEQKMFCSRGILELSHCKNGQEYMFGRSCCEHLDKVDAIIFALSKEIGEERTSKVILKTLQSLPKSIDDKQRRNLIIEIVELKSKINQMSEHLRGRSPLMNDFAINKKNLDFLSQNVTEMAKDVNMHRRQSALEMMKCQEQEVSVAAINKKIIDLENTIKNFQLGEQSLIQLRKDNEYLGSQLEEAKEKHDCEITQMEFDLYEKNEQLQEALTTNNCLYQQMKKLESQHDSIALLNASVSCESLFFEQSSCRDTENNVPSVEKNNQTTQTRLQDVKPDYLSKQNKATTTGCILKDQATSTYRCGNSRQMKENCHNKKMKQLQEINQQLQQSMRNCFMKTKFVFNEIFEKERENEDLLHRLAASKQLLRQYERQLEDTNHVLTNP
eukprot:GHVL01009099.1.p1 GENE.GHVL01009099.1~~GHVL01009099.1.p1  ORF type:complete len:452 (-),score=72.41 GHVL01009099.1:1330-2685(-)